MFALEDLEDASIGTRQLRLRPPARADLDPLDRAIRETLPELIRWLPWARPGHDRGDTRRYLRHARAARLRRTAFEYALFDRGSDELLGMASLHRIDWVRRCAGVGYWVRRSAWGRGLATEAAGAVIRHGLLDQDLHRLEVHIAPGNTGSLRVAEKLGLPREGIAREYEYVDGQYVDHVQFAILRSQIGRLP